MGGVRVKLRFSGGALTGVVVVMAVAVSRDEMKLT
jgi:hypothetical protein